MTEKTDPISTFMQEPSMAESVPSRSEVFLRFTRRSMVILLLLVLSLGLMGLAMVLWPDGAVSRSFERASWAVAIGIVLVGSVLQTSWRRHRFTADSAEVKAVMNDELRRNSMDRARLIAFVVVLLAQVPIALLFSHTALGLGFGDLPAFRAVMAMAVSTITLGMTVFIVSFLLFDRE